MFSVVLSAGCQHQALDEQHRNGRRIFAYFNNDPDAVAVANATTLRSALQNLI